MKLYTVRRRGREKIQGLPIEVHADEVEVHLNAAQLTRTEVLVQDDNGIKVGSVEREPNGRLTKWVDTERVARG